MEKKIAECISQVKEKMIKFGEIYEGSKDAIIDSNALELLDDISKGVKLIHFIGKTFDMIKFKMFLKGLGRGEIREVDIDRLSRYIDSPPKAEFIAQTFKKIVMSNSKKATCLLGLQYSEIIKKILR